MSDEPPTPPSGVSTAVVEALDGYSPERLRRVARYADELADHREREGRTTEEDEGAEGAEDDAVDDRPDDRPDEVPSKATITVKEINDNRYYYWQWREGDTIRSRYRGPVSPDE